jgi:signal transduction histidine kinase
MLVLDPRGRVASLNPAAQAILGLTEKRSLGQPVQDLLPNCAEWAGSLQVAEPGQSEIHLGTGPETHHYMLETSALKDWRGLEVGHMLLLHDVTRLKQAQAQIIEQQRVLAMLQEREQLARELHDSLGQSFAFVSTQGQAIHRLLGRGDVSTADEYVARLVEVAREADVDIRESILGLRSLHLEHGLFQALTQYLARYEKNTLIHTKLIRPVSLQDGCLDAQVEVQLVRILQEALTNIRKHAKARHVEIKFEAGQDCVTVTVRDDGQGFDPAEHMDESGEHIGLRVMNERAKGIGGSISLQSMPGQGTQLQVQVPLGVSHGL